MMDAGLIIYSLGDVFVKEGRSSVGDSCRDIEMDACGKQMS
jgi:hypothetical protein